MLCPANFPGEMLPIVLDRVGGSADVECGGLPVEGGLAAAVFARGRSRRAAVSWHSHSWLCPAQH